MNLKQVFIFSILLVSMLSCSEGNVKKHVLPFIGNFDIEYKLVDGIEVWIADFFFTSCQTICPTMTTNLKRLNKETEDIQDHIQFISFTIDPDRDSPETLKRYKNHYGIESKNWTFLTGDEEKTHLLGIENFQIFAGRDDESQGGYAHSGAFTLVDKEGFVRGVYLGTDAKQVDQLQKDLRLFLNEEYGIFGSK